MNVLLRATSCDNLSEKRRKKIHWCLSSVSATFQQRYTVLLVPVAHILHVIIYIHLKLSRPK